MRFTSLQDYQTIVKINQELINEVLDTPVILYKQNSEKTAINSYGEAKTRVWYQGVNVPCRVERAQQNPTQEGQTVDMVQECRFYFLRAELEQRNVYPETGDIVFFDNQYYEVHNTNETQLWAGRTEYRFSIVCESHLTRKTNLQLEPPAV